MLRVSGRSRGIERCARELVLNRLKDTAHVPDWSAKDTPAEVAVRADRESDRVELQEQVLCARRSVSWPRGISV